MLIVGIAVIVVGLGDFMLAAMFARGEAARAPGGLGDDAQPSSLSRALKLAGVATILVGVGLVVSELAG